ncbi:MAG: inositol monophosphatase family protein [Pseudomonadota bacterium]
MDTKILVFANNIADLARSIAIESFRSELVLKRKSDTSPVSNIDLAIETKLFQLISSRFPKHGFMGEELGEFNKESAYQWVIDPIDGTSSFIAGKPTFSILISLLYEGNPILGIIDQPITGERWVGQKGKKTEFNSRPCAIKSIEEPFLRLACTTPFMFKDSEFKIFKKISSLASSISFGGDAYNYGLLALGHMEIILEADLKYYDVAALIPVVEGSGGVITNWQGDLIRKDSFDGRVLATSHRTLHNSILTQIDSCIL